MTAPATVSLPTRDEAITRLEEAAKRVDESTTLDPTEKHDILRDLAPVYVTLCNQPTWSTSRRRATPGDLHRAALLIEGVARLPEWPAGLRRPLLNDAARLDRVLTDVRTVQRIHEGSGP